MNMVMFAVTFVGDFWKNETPLQLGSVFERSLSYSFASGFYTRTKTFQPKSFRDFEARYTHDLRSVPKFMTVFHDVMLPLISLMSYYTISIGHLVH